MKKTLLFSAALLATIAASAQTIVWPSSVNRETKEANVSAIVTGSESITATDITPGADIKIGDKDGANAVTAVKNTTGENLQFPSETEGMISWRPINGNVDGAEATADLAEGAGAYIDFTIEEGDIEKTLAGMSSFEFDVTKVGTDAIRINVKLIGEGDTNVDTGWLINADNAKSFGDEYQADYDAEAKNKDNPWDEAANGYNPSRNDGSKGVSGGANANGISHVKLAVPAEFAASNPYKVTLRIAIIKCANNKDLAVNAVTFNFGGSDTPQPGGDDQTLDIDLTAASWGWGWGVNTSNDGANLVGELTGGWGAVSTGWDPAADWSAYKTLVCVIESAESSLAPGEDGPFFQILAKGNSDDEKAAYYSFSETFTSQKTFEIPLDPKYAGTVKQFWFQGKAAGDKIVISKVYLTTKEATTGIQSAKAQAQKSAIRYNLAGQKVDGNYKGIVIENGKKMMVK